MIRRILTIYISYKYYRISYYIKINLTANHYYKLLWSSESFEVKYNIRFGIPIEFPSQRKYLNRCMNKEIGLMWSRESFEVKYNIRFGIPIKFPSQRKKLLKSVQKERNYALIKNAKIVMDVRASQY